MVAHPNIASCPQCGSLIWVNVLTKTGQPGPFDFYPEAEYLVIKAVGLNAVLSQGIGVGLGTAHYCPPTFNVSRIYEDSEIGQDAILAGCSHSS